MPQISSLRFYFENIPISLWYPGQGYCFLFSSKFSALCYFTAAGDSVTTAEMRNIEAAAIVMKSWTWGWFKLVTNVALISIRSQSLIKALDVILLNPRIENIHRLTYKLKTIILMSGMVIRMYDIYHYTWLYVRPKIFVFLRSASLGFAVVFFLFLVSFCLLSLPVFVEGKEATIRHIHSHITCGSILIFVTKNVDLLLASCSWGELNRCDLEIMPFKLQTSMCNLAWNETRHHSTQKSVSKTMWGEGYA